MTPYCLDMLQRISTSYPFPLGLLCMQPLTASSVQVMKRLMNFSRLSWCSSGHKLCPEKSEVVVCCCQGFNMAVRHASMQLPDSAIKLDQLIQQRINGSLKVSLLKPLS